MRAIQIGPKPTFDLSVAEVEAPRLASEQDVRIEVVATAVNRADLLQRRGLYPPPIGAPVILGLECAGVIREVGPAVRNLVVGDSVMALLAGGGYAEEVVVDARSVLKKPAGFSFAEAAAFMETTMTVYSNLFLLGAAEAGQRVLVHGGGSGIGTTALVLGKEAGLSIFVTAGSDEKCQRCLALGANAAFNYNARDFVAAVSAATNGAGVHLVLDSIGAAYFDKNVACLREDGRLLLIGLQSGAKVETSLAPLLQKRLQIIGSTLRARSAEAKGAIVAAFSARFGEALAAGRIRPVLHGEIPLARASDAHDVLLASAHFGKVVLRVRPDPSS